MIDETITKIEDRIRNAKAIPETSRSDLLKLIGTLKKEITQLPQTKSEQAESITSFTDSTMREATREQIDPHLVKLSKEALSASVREFETSHPTLVEIVNSICHMLSNLGI